MPKEDISGRLVKAVVHACKEEPSQNAWFDAETMTRCVHDSVNIGMAVDSSHGLYVPVLKNADQFDDKGIRNWLNETVNGIRERKIGRESLQMPLLLCLTLSQDYGNTCCVPPQVAIVGAGRIIERVVMKMTSLSPLR